MYAYAWWEILVCALLVGCFLAAGPWFLGVRLVPGAVVVKGWFRTRRILVERIIKVEPVECISMLVGFGVGFIPFIGKVRMIEVETEERGRWRGTSLPETLGRYNTTLLVAREIRAHAGLAR